MAYERYDELVEKTLGGEWEKHKYRGTVVLKCKPKGGKGKGGK